MHSFHPPILIYLELWARLFKSNNVISSNFQCIQRKTLPFFSKNCKELLQQLLTFFLHPPPTPLPPNLKIETSDFMCTRKIKHSLTNDFVKANTTLNNKARYVRQINTCRQIISCFWSWVHVDKTNSHKGT